MNKSGVGGHQPPSRTTRWLGASLHAIIIGIDNYPKLISLAGSIADAQQMEMFLVSDLKVPKDHIISLYDRYASRKAIMNAFMMLQKDPRIHEGDPILIFFAGHGGLAEAEPKWRQKYGSSKIQVIFPYDYGLPVSNSNSSVDCIPDVTIAELLNQLAAAKGNNITVIFDSCHSASGTRDDLERPGLKARSADVLFPIPDDIDDDILAHSSLSTKIGRSSELLLYSDQASHIHIAACGSNQKAWEDEGRGYFTAVLLDTLRKSRVDNITYENLLKALPLISSQSPHCYGRNKSRILFDSRLDVQTRVFIPVVCDLEDDSWILQLQAGDESGVTENSVWDIHETATEDSVPRARVVADFPDIGTTLLSLGNRQDEMWLDKLARGAPRHTKIRVYARHLHAGQDTVLRVWCPVQSLRDLLRPHNAASNAIKGTIHEVGYVMEQDRNRADLELDFYSRAAKPEVVFRLRNPIAETYGISELKYRKPASREEIETVLFAAAKWRWHLERTNRYPQNRSPQIDPMTMMRIATRVRGKREYLDKPVTMPAQRGMIEFVARGNDLYGVELISRSKLPLYIRMFYFDATDFSIGDMFGQTVANGAEDATIPVGGKIVIGDGRDGGSPLKFGVSPESRAELGYLKVFWSTIPLEVSDMAQKSAFKMRPGSIGRAVGRAEVQPTHDWGTMCLALVMKAA
ncbi:Caspase domain, partial [Rhizoctonia solani]